MVYGMTTIKVEHIYQIPAKYTEIIKWVDGDEWWYKNGGWFREDGPAIIRKSGYKEWYLSGKLIWASNWAKFDLRNKIIFSKEPHPKRPTVQIWEYLDKDRIQERIMIPGMEEHIII